jgi:hypothetical protein
MTRTYRGRGRAGDERGDRHSARRLQRRARDDQDLPDLDHAARAERRTVLGAKPFPKADRAGRFVTLASGIASDEDALPIRADGRVVGATLKAGQAAGYFLAAPPSAG